MNLHRPTLAAACLLAGGLAAGLGAAVPAGAATVATPATSYHFRTLDNSNDLTFNQLLGINNHGKIAGYYGSGDRGHKNKGYLLLPPYRQSGYRVENYPGSAQTQVTGLNDMGVTVGFFTRTNNADPATNANFGFWSKNGRFHKVVFPGAHAKPAVDQLLGVNNGGIAVGFYVAANGNSRGYTYNTRTGKFRTIPVPGSVSVTAAAIDNKNHIAGFFSTSGGATKSFLVSGTHVRVFAKAGADGGTFALGVNDHDEVVGFYTVGNNNYGFTWTAKGGFKTIKDPSGPNQTFVNGLNNAGDLVGFYMSANGRTHGMLATP